MNLSNCVLWLSPHIALLLFITLKTFHKSLGVCGFMKFNLVNKKLNCFNTPAILLCKTTHNSEERKLSLCESYGNNHEFGD